MQIQGCHRVFNWLDMESWRIDDISNPWINLSLDGMRLKLSRLLGSSCMLISLPHFDHSDAIQIRCLGCIQSTIKVSSFTKHWERLRDLKDGRKVLVEEVIHSWKENKKGYIPESSRESKCCHSRWKKPTAGVSLHSAAR